MENKQILFTERGRINVVAKQSDWRLGADEILIKNHYSIISNGTELACLDGKEPWFGFPRVPGYASIGEVIDRGAEVCDFAVGDLVLCESPHSAYFKLSPTQALCLPIPSGLDERLAVFAKIAAFGICAVEVSNIQLGDYVGVIGMGLVGNLAAQIAALQGGIVFGIGRSPFHLQKAVECGLTCLPPLDWSAIRGQVAALTMETGLNSLIDATGASEVVASALPLLARAGEIILLGSPRDAYQADLTRILRYIHLADLGCIQLKSAHEWMHPLKDSPYLKHSRERNARIALRLIQEEKIHVAPLLTRVVKPEEAAEAYAALARRNRDCLGVLFDWTDCS